MSQKKDDRARYAWNITLAAVAGQVGCLTVVIIFLAFFAGRWLDARFDTHPRFIVASLICSVPVALISMVGVVRWTTNRMQFDQSVKEQTLPEEDADIGKQT